MRHIISILLQNEAGALARVASMFSSRGYNIDSLSVAPTHDPSVSRLSLVTTGTDQVIHQIIQQTQTSGNGGAAPGEFEVFNPATGEDVELQQRTPVARQQRVTAARASQLGGQQLRLGLEIGQIEHCGSSQATKLLHQIPRVEPPYPS